MLDPTPRHNADQDVRILRDLTDMERTLESARDDAEVQAVLAPAGYGLDALDALLDRAARAADAYDARARAMSAEDRAGEDESTRFADARRDYVAFREIARARFKGDPTATAALGLAGNTADGLSAFVRQARSSYANATQDPYAERIAVRGYDTKRLDALTATLDALLTASGADDSQDARAVEATGERDSDMGTLRREFAEFRDTARPLLRPFPELARRIGL